MAPRARASRYRTWARSGSSKGWLKVRISSGSHGDALQPVPQFLEKSSQVRRAGVDIRGTQPGVPDVAVNLNGIDLSGTTAGSTSAGSTHKTSSTQNTPANTAQNATQQPQKEVSITSTASLLSHLQRSLASTPAVD